MIKKIILGIVILVAIFYGFQFATSSSGGFGYDKVEFSTELIIQNINNTNQTGVADGNASSICSGGNVLLGNGTCITWSADTDTTYTGSLGVNLSGTTFSHNDSSSVSDSDNSGQTFIQDLTFDTFGHVISLATATATGITWTNALNGTLSTWANSVNGTLASLSTVLGFSYYNTTDFVIDDYRLETNNTFATNVSFNASINSTTDGVVRTFNNSCKEIANATGFFLIC